VTFPYKSGSFLDASTVATEHSRFVEDAAQAKWGPCHSCSCRGFRSRPAKDNICGDCGHHWEMHY